MRQVVALIVMVLVAAVKCAPVVNVGLRVLGGDLDLDDEEGGNSTTLDISLDKEGIGLNKKTNTHAEGYTSEEDHDDQSLSYADADKDSSNAKSIASANNHYRQEDKTEDTEKNQGLVIGLHGIETHDNNKKIDERYTDEQNSNSSAYAVAGANKESDFSGSYTDQNRENTAEHERIITEDKKNAKYSLFERPSSNHEQSRDREHQKRKISDGKSETSLNENYNDNGQVIQKQSQSGDGYNAYESEDEDEHSESTNQNGSKNSYNSGNYVPYEVYRQLNIDAKRLGLHRGNYPALRPKNAAKMQVYRNIKDDFLQAVANKIHNAEIINTGNGHVRIVERNRDTGKLKIGNTRSKYGDSQKSHYRTLAQRIGTSPVNSHYANVQLVESKYDNLPLFDNINYGKVRHGKGSTRDYKKGHIGDSKFVGNKDDNYSNTRDAPYGSSDASFTVDSIDPIVKKEILSKSVNDILKMLKASGDVADAEKSTDYSINDNKEIIFFPKNNRNKIIINNNNGNITYSKVENEITRPRGDGIHKSEHKKSGEHISKKKEDDKPDNTRYDKTTRTDNGSQPKSDVLVDFYKNENSLKNDQDIKQDQYQNIEKNKDLYDTDSVKNVKAMTETEYDQSKNTLNSTNAEMERLKDETRAYEVKDTYNSDTVKKETQVHKLQENSSDEVKINSKYRTVNFLNSIEDDKVDYNNSTENSFNNDPLVTMDSKPDKLEISKIDENSNYTSHNGEIDLSNTDTTDNSNVDSSFTETTPIPVGNFNSESDDKSLSNLTDTAISNGNNTFGTSNNTNISLVKPDYDTLYSDNTNDTKVGLTAPSEYSSNVTNSNMFDNKTATSDGFSTTIAISTSDSDIHESNANTNFVTSNDSTNSSSTDKFEDIDTQNISITNSSGRDFNIDTDSDTYTSSDTDLDKTVIGIPKNNNSSNFFSSQHSDDKQDSTSSTELTNSKTSDSESKNNVVQVNDTFVPVSVHYLPENSNISTTSEMSINSDDTKQFAFNSASPQYASDFATTIAPDIFLNTSMKPSSDTLPSSSSTDGTDKNDISDTNITSLNSNSNTTNNSDILNTNEQVDSEKDIMHSNTSGIENTNIAFNDVINKTETKTENTDVKEKNNNMDDVTSGATNNTIERNNDISNIYIETSSSNTGSKNIKNDLSIIDNTPTIESITNSYKKNIDTEGTNLETSNSNADAKVKTSSNEAATIGSNADIANIRSDASTSETVTKNIIKDADDNISYTLSQFTTETVSNNADMSNENSEDTETADSYRNSTDSSRSSIANVDEQYIDNNITDSNAAATVFTDSSNDSPAVTTTISTTTASTVTATAIAGSNLGGEANPMYDKSSGTFDNQNFTVTRSVSSSDSSTGVKTDNKPTNIESRSDKDNSGKSLNEVAYKQDESESKSDESRSASEEPVFAVDAANTYNSGSAEATG